MTSASTGRRRDGIAEVAMQRAQQPQAELHRQRLVEAVGGAQLRGELLRRIGRQHGDQRIARRDVHEQKQTSATLMTIGMT